MGGFTINGCGASDSYYKLKSVGHFYCSRCQKEREFWLDELRMKIRVLYIPTVTVNKKYAVVCGCCERGYYVEENVKNDILNGLVDVSVENNSLVIHRRSPAIKEQPVEAENPQNEQGGNSNTNEIIADASVNEQSVDDVQSSAEPNDEKIADSVFEMPLFEKRTIKQCPACKLLFNEDVNFCAICGKKLEPR